MESDESIDFVDSEAVNTYGSVVAKEEYENPCEYFEEGENVDPRRFHPFIKFAILVKKEQESVEVTSLWRGACAQKSGRGCCLCKAANKNCNANCQCR